MTKISQITGVSTELTDDDLLEKERADGISEYFTALQIKEYLFSNEIVTPAGGGQAGATQLTKYDNHVDTVAAPGDGVKFLPAVKCLKQRIKNNGAFWIWVYPPLGANFLGLAINQPVKLNPGNGFEVTCFINNELRR